MKLLLFSSFILALTTGSNADASKRLLQQSEQASCGEVLATWTSGVIGDLIETGIDQNLGPAGADLKTLALPQIKYGVQVRKICAVCSDFMEDCGYGGDVAHSGLVMIPLKDDNSTSIAGGTHKAVLYNHGTRAVAQPSTDFVYQDNFFEIVLSTLYTAATRSVTIMSDYMSQGESFGQVYRGYIVRKSYETSVTPLYFQAKKLLEDETDCSAVADSIFIMGYSEGGYSSVAVAEKMHSMGIDIIRVDPGGAPFDVSGATFVDIVDFVNNGTFPEGVRFYLQYLGFSFSSSRSDMPNFEAGQDLLTSEARQTMLDFLASDLPDFEVPGIEAANNMVPVDDMLSVYNPDFISFIETAIAENDRDPCKNRPIAGVNDLLCEAMKEQDIHLVLQNAQYPVVVCFSPGDEIVSIRNMPDVSGNPNVTFLEAEGTHSAAGNTCFVASTQYILSPGFQDYSVTELTSDTCRQSGGAEDQGNASSVGDDGVIEDDETDDEEDKTDREDAGADDEDVSTGVLRLDLLVVLAIIALADPLASMF
ncbi:unknown protein [Seminavis robusta]|uniref:Uncharacterized protein n=1 Tax=Seminavis robusta TaxID=568900 RepID=A0A9N8DLB9_9STRA|nr:unknown protein [Seminavis robusta]|eukprot:Sro187_g080970.1 n/a (535) ;mRNA; f:56306-57910